MIKYLIDSSIWIDYFRSGKKSSDLDQLIDDNLISVNDLILSELIPALALRKQNKVIKLLHSIDNTTLNIDWAEITKLQTKCLMHGYNGIGIPDLIIVQNAIQTKSTIWSLDKHFILLSEITKLKVKN